jgi:hypothetical protein
MGVDTHVSVTGASVRVDAVAVLGPWEAASYARKILAAVTDALPAGGPFKPCKLCGDIVMWAETGTGAKLPLSLGADPDGTLALRADSGQVRVRRCPPDMPLRPGEQRARCHFDVCREDARRRGRRAERELLARLADADGNGTGVLPHELARLLAASDAYLGIRPLSPRPGRVSFPRR